MKKKIIIVAILFAVLGLSYPATAQQKVEVDNSVYQFEPVPEGEHVSHAFIIKNTGDALLTIEKVSPP